MMFRDKMYGTYTCACPLLRIRAFLIKFHIFRLSGYEYTIQKREACENELSNPERIRRLAILTTRHFERISTRIRE